MKNIYIPRLVFLVLVLPVFSVSAQNNFWSDIPAPELNSRKEAMENLPAKFRSVALDTTRLLTFFKTVPKEGISVKPVPFTIPMPDGTLQQFSIVETSIMEAELSAQLPNFKTYSGQGVEDKSATIQIDWTANGLHAMILSPVFGSVFVDPFGSGILTKYISYYKKDAKRTRLFEEDEPVIPERGATGRQANRVEAVSCIGGTLRTYRLAVACTGEYTGVAGGTKEKAMSAIMTTVDRVNGVYEKELAIRLKLVTNMKIIFIDSTTDPFTNYNSDKLIDESQQVIDDSIGFGNYDIGHTFSTGINGLAAIGIVCQNGFKALGVTGQPNPVGDPFDIDYVAHEMGHQFGANHTFNSTTKVCGRAKQWQIKTNAEPGSGSTIMAYAGICGNTDLQPNSDPQFHAVSFDEMIAYTTTGAGNTCPVPTPTGNVSPIVEAGPDYTIPKSTPFYLLGSGFHPLNNLLFYSWEEADVGGPSVEWNSDVPPAPLFRSFPPVVVPIRFFPKLSSLVNNRDSIGEFLPTQARVMKFRLTARDYKPAGGGVCTDSMKVTVNVASGPFLVTKPNTPVIWYVKDSVLVTWDVANTTAAPVSCANVSIQLSTDGGYGFPTTILPTAPNNGNKKIKVPDFVTTTARIKVQAVNNIFFDISNENFIIKRNTIPAFNFGRDASLDICSNAGALNLQTYLFGYDPDGGQTITWDVVTAPSHGMLSGLAATAVTSGGAVSPTDVYYTPPANYNGKDTFKISISDSIDSDTITLIAHVKLLPSTPTTINGAATVNAPQSAVPYKVSPLDSNATNYYWTFFGSGGTINGNGDSSITIDFAPYAHSGPLEVYASNNCGSSSYLQKFITVNGVLPEYESNLRAYFVRNEVQIAWTVLNELNVVKYEVERSSDAVSFTKIGEVISVNPVASYNYVYTDMRPFSGIGFYRLKVINKDGTFRYTAVVKINTGINKPSIVVTPNPVQTRDFNLQLYNIPASKYNLMLFDSKGSIVQKKVIINTAGTAVFNLALPTFVQKGVYLLKLSDEKNSFNCKLIVQ